MSIIVAEPPTVAARSLIRALAASDVAEVTRLDALLQGRTRNAYFARRLAAAVREPRFHVQLCSTDASGITGFVLARVQEGEFGGTARTLRIEVIGTRPDTQGRGVATALLDALVAWSARHDVSGLETQTAWNDHVMIRWLDGAGFRLAACHVVDCALAPLQDMPAREGTEEVAQELRYDGASADGEPARLARDVARIDSMCLADLDAIARIDRRASGRDRRAYIERKLGEALQDSSVRVSLTARLGDTVAGYLMARTDYGDFGRPEPVAVLDTIAVDEGFAHRGVGHALLSQLAANLAALRIERLETTVPPRDVRLLGFLYDVGFAPSERLPFVRPLA